MSTDIGPPVIILVQLEGIKTLGNAIKVIEFKLDSVFDLLNIQYKFDSIFRNDKSLKSKYKTICSELISIFTDPEVEVIQDNVPKTDPFLADPRNMKLYWNRDDVGYFLTNQGKTVLKFSLFQQCTLIVRKRSNYKLQTIAY